MNVSAWTLLTVIPPLLAVEGFFSGSEIALLSADRLVLKQAARKGSRRAKLALELLTRPERILSSTLLVTNFCMIGISALTSLYFLSRDVEHGELLAVAVTSPLVVLLGELIPKTIYQRHADRIAPWVALPVSAAFWAFYPITRVLSGYTSRLSQLLGPLEELLTGRKRTTREELRSMLSYGKRESEIKPSERRMIKRIFDFKDTEAKHALIPLVKVEAVEERTTIRQALERFNHHRHSRMPVYSGRIDNIVGVIEVADLFSVKDPELPIQSFVTPARYVAETQSLENLIGEMQQDTEEMVVVVDEHGGAVGILTLEDIVEEIVGEIHDEYDSDSAPFKEFSDKSWLVQARMEIQQINERLGLELPEGDYETLGGFLLQQFGRIPEVRDELYFDTQGGSLKFTVRKASERKIEAVLIERRPSAQAE